MQSAPIDLNRVRQLFSQAEKLKAGDFINREIAARMLERLQLVRLNPHFVVDAGCGLGTDLRLLQNNYPNAHIIGVDASQELLLHGVKEQGLVKPWQRFSSLFSAGKKNAHTIFNRINADFCRFPLADQAMDLVWSNLALHWHPEPDQVFKEWKRILKGDGLLMFSCFGPDTLKEIRYAFDEEAHTLPFVDMHDFGDMLVSAGFATPVMDMEIMTLTYATVLALLADVRSLGGNPLQTRSKGLMSKAKWQAMCRKLEGSRREDGRIPLTLEIIYGHAFKPVPTYHPKESIVQFHRLKK